MKTAAPEREDEEIIRRVVAGATQEFEILLERHRDRVFGIVGRHVPAQDVENVAYEVFIEAHRSLDRFSGKSPFEHWLSRIAVRRCCDYWRGRSRRREETAPPLEAGPEEWLGRMLTRASQEEFDRDVEQREAVEVLDWALARLNEKDRMVLSLIHLEGRSVAEAAELTGWSRANVKIRALRARHALRKILARAMERSP